MATAVSPAKNAVTGTQPHRRNQTRQRMGWVRDLPDQRDHLFSAPSPVTGNLPPKVDMRALCPPVYDQAQLGSCTANAIGGLFEFVGMKEGFASVAPSRLFIYYNERVIEGTVNSDSGAQIRDGIKTVSQQGACKETDWPYDVTKFADKPADAAYGDAAQSRAVEYLRITPVLSQLKACLAQGYPFVFGFAVYTSFLSDQVAHSGVGTLPQPGDNLEGGHAVMAVGYDDSNQVFWVRNSWGENWGQAGYFSLPYAYLTDANLSSDFWTIRQVSAAAKAVETTA